MHLDDIVARKRADLGRARADDLRGPGRSAAPVPGRFTAALTGPDVAIIAEIKPASPSKGELLPLALAGPLARSYAAAGAAAVSVLADTPFFGGSPALVAQIAADPQVDVPVMFKDFIVDPRQVQLAHDCGADAVLVIVRAVDDAELAQVLAAAADLGLDAVVETFDEREIERALAAGASVIGVNNRDLQTFAVNLDNAARLRDLIPAGIVTVSESGVNGRADLQRVAAGGFDACLIGELLLTAADPARTLHDLLGLPVNSGRTVTA